MNKKILSIALAALMLAVVFSPINSSVKGTVSAAAMDQSMNKNTRSADDTTTAYRTAVSQFNSDFSTYVDALTNKQESTYTMIGALSGGYNRTLTSSSDVSSIPNSDLLAFMDAFQNGYANYIDAFLKGYEMVQSWNRIKNITMEKLGTRFFVMAAFVAGLGMLAYGGYKMVKGAFNKNTDMSKKIIDDASAEDMKKINAELGLPETATKEEVKSHLDSLSLADKNIAANKIQTLDINADLSTSHGAEIRQNQADIAVNVGKDGVKLYAGAITTVTGGQGMDKLAGAMGASEEAAAALDTTLTLTSKQPLDVLGDNIDASITSKTKESVSLDTPTEKKTESEAKTLLDKAAKGAATEEELADAGDSLAEKLAEDNKADLKTEEGWYGDKTVYVPEKAVVQNVGEVKKDEKIQVPDIGNSELMVVDDDEVPVVDASVNPSTDEEKDPDSEVEVEVEYIDDAEIPAPSDIPIDVVFCVDLTGSMGDDIGAVVESANNMLLSMQLRTTNYRMGFVGFRDIEVDSVPFERFSFSSDPDTIRANINALPGMVNGGGDIPESVYEGLYLAYGMPWRDGVEHTVILMGDAPPKTSYGRGATYNNVTASEINEIANMTFDENVIGNLSKEKNIHVYPIVVPTGYEYYDENAVSAFDDIANATGGKSYKAEDAGDVPNVIMSVLDSAIDQAEDTSGGNTKDTQGTASSDSSSIVPCLAGLGILVLLVVVVVVVLASRKKKGQGGVAQPPQAYSAPETTAPQPSTQTPPPPPAVPEPTKVPEDKDDGEDVEDMWGQD